MAEIVPTVELSRTLFIFLNYLIVGLFVAMNLYITYQIVRSYGPVLFSLFAGEREIEPAPRGWSLLPDVSDAIKNAFGLALMVIGVVLTLSIFGMVWGIPLFMIGWDIRDRVAREEPQSEREDRARA